MPDLKQVREFWERNPLFSGERDPSAPEFFQEHDAIYRQDVLRHVEIARHFAFPDAGATVLDLGCGIGFWTAEFARRGQQRIYAVDLSPASIELARRRLNDAGDVVFQVENAERLSFPDGMFDHVNCQGVVHHTPDTDAALREIQRVLRPGGTASVSVYFDNLIVRHYDRFAHALRALWSLLGADRGRGRDFSLARSKEDLVRLYDGIDNPLGKSYSRNQFVRMLAQAGLTEIRVGYFFFPFRFIKLSLPAWLERVLLWCLPFMMVANCRKQ